MANRNLFTSLYFFLVFIELITEWKIESYPLLQYFAKPLPIIFLIVSLKRGSHISYVRLALFGLIFSLSGDILLLFQGIQPIYFILGLISFLTAHICYIFSFNSVINDKIIDVFKSPVKGFFGLLYISYATIIYSILFPHLGDLKIPVLIYVFVILTMLLKAYSLNHMITKAYPLFIGASFFITSDTLLAFNKFYIPIVHSGIWIMSTYYLAQYFISFGILKLQNN